MRCDHCGQELRDTLTSADMAQPDGELVQVPAASPTGLIVVEAEHVRRMECALELVAAWWRDVYPPDVFTGASGDAGAVRVVEVRQALQAAGYNVGGEG